MTVKNSMLGNLRSKYDFRSDILDVIIGGRSMIDTPEGFLLSSAEAANRFLAGYGYDLENPVERAELLGNHHEALNFIRKHFLQPENSQGLKLEIPRKIIELVDVRELLLMASMHFPGQNADSQGQYLRNWACALLKVMHTIAHIDKDLRTPYFTDIQTQIFDRIYKVIHRDAEGQLYLGLTDDDPHRVNLVAYQTKPKKTRDSIILKLLHKPENVAEDIFDRIGVRFVTFDRLGTLRVIKYLRDRMIVTPPNVKPSRSRNTLLDIEPFRARNRELLESAEHGQISEDELIRRLEEEIRPPTALSDNPHSSEHYRAIQFTCRQLIKLKNPLYADLKGLKGLMRSQPQNTMTEEMVRAIERIDLKYLQREVRFFYPFEVQVMDQKSAEDNEAGRSAHSEYKRAQIHTALKRVMGVLASGGNPADAS